MIFNILFLDSISARTGFLGRVMYRKVKIFH